MRSSIRRITVAAGTRPPSTSTPPTCMWTGPCSAWTADRSAGERETGRLSARSLPVRMRACRSPAGDPPRRPRRGSRNSERVRAFALRTGLILPRPMHSEAEASLLERASAAGRRDGGGDRDLRGLLGGGARRGRWMPERDAPPDRLLRGQRAPVRMEGHRARDPARDGSARPAIAAARRSSGTSRARHGGRGRDGRPRSTCLFIDGDHSEEGTRSDWDAFSPHVVVGGVVIFHDARRRPAAAGATRGPGRRSWWTRSSAASGRCPAGGSWTRSTARSPSSGSPESALGCVRRRAGPCRRRGPTTGALTPKPRVSSWKWWRMCSSRSRLPNRVLGLWWCRW